MSNRVHPAWKKDVQRRKKYGVRVKNETGWVEDIHERSQKAGSDLARWVLMDCRAPVSGSLSLLKLE